MAVSRPRWPLRVLLPLGDLAAATAGLLLGRLAFNAWSPAAGDGAPLGPADLLGPSPWLPPGSLVLALWLFALWAEGLYDALRSVDRLRLGRALTRAAVVVLVGAILFQFFTAHRVYSRLMLVVAVGGGALLVAAWRLSVLWAGAVLSLRWVGREGVVVVGTGPDAVLVAERLERHAAHVYQVRGFLEAGRHEPRAVDEVVGTVSDLRQVVNDHDVGLVVLASRVLTREEALALATDCGRMGLSVLEVPFTFGLVWARVQPAALGELELVRIGGLAYPTLAETAKRIIDLVLVAVGGPLILPLLLAVAVAIKLQDGGPVLFVSKRAGRGGRAFDFYKFRSMVVDAYELRDTLDNEADGRLFKVAEDPRLTPLGGFLRRWSIDELPQLLNVLKGDMNLVGPRPLPVEDLAGIEEDPEHWFWFEQRSRVKPGITGLWQVEGRSDLPFEAMVDLDVRYIQSWSLLLDLQVLARTVPAVLRRRGAR